MNPSFPKLPACFSTTILHPHFKACLERLHQIVRLKTARIIIVTGPTGSGKTTLRYRFAEEIESLAAPEMENDPEMVPYGAISVKAPGPTAFSWKDNYIQLMRSLQHPFAECRGIAHNGSHADPKQEPMKVIALEQAQRLSNDRLFRVLQRTIEHRNPKVILLDEAHHLLRLASAQSLVNQLEHLKYLADETRTPHVLFGTYESIQFMDLSGSLIRRREIVHLPRYVFNPADAEKSIEGFAMAVAEYARDLDSVSHVDLLKEVPFLYQGSVGCVGVLREWLLGAYQRVETNSPRKITKRLLEQTMLESSDRLKLLNEAQKGERYFAARSICEQNYLTQLGFGRPQDVPANPETQASESPKKKHRPFKRKPHNDPVGTDHLDPKKLQLVA